MELAKVNTNVNKLLIHERERLLSNMHFVISELLHATLLVKKSNL